MNTDETTTTETNETSAAREGGAGTTGATEGNAEKETPTTPAMEVQKVWEATVAEMAGWSPADHDRGEGMMSTIESGMEAVVGQPVQATIMAVMMMISASSKITKVCLTKFLIRDKARFNLTDQDIISLLNGVITFTKHFTVEVRLPEALRAILTQILAD